MTDISIDSKFYSLSPDECQKALKTNSDIGLTDAQVKERQAAFGLNELEQGKKETIWDKIKEQFQDNLVRMLLTAAIISYLVSLFEKEEESEHSIPAWIEPAVIFSILILNTIVGIYQDLDAEKAIEALKVLQSPEATTKRNSQWKSIPSKELVPGDIVQVQQGDKIPADLRLLEIKTVTLKVDQSALTGESDPVSKQSQNLTQEELAKFKKVDIQAKKNYLFGSSLVNNGIGIGVVVATGMKSEIGIIQKQVQDAGKEKEEELTPLQKKLEEFGNMLEKVIVVICIIVWLVNIPNFSDEAFGNIFLGALYYFKIAVSLAVAAIPEGLSIVITTALALGSRKMAKKKAIIRKLPSVETLGCTTIICSDKTGTLTTNQMCVEHFIVLADNKDQTNIISFTVEGNGYSIQGKIPEFEKWIQNELPQNIKRFCQSITQCNDSKLMLDSNNLVSKSGLPTEAALKVLCEKIGPYDPKNKVKPDLQNLEQYSQIINSTIKKLATLEFTRDRKSMSVIVSEQGKTDNLMFIKGAPDYLLKKSKYVLGRDGEIIQLTEQGKEALSNKIKEFARKGLRTLAICMKQDLGEFSSYNGPLHKAHKQLEDSANYGNFEKDGIIIGVVAVRDPPRKEVKDSIQKCKEAGISVIMITGDIKETAESIAKDIHIISEGQEATRSFTGAEFEELSDEQKKQALKQVITTPSGFVLSRTEPSHKRKLVKLLGELDQVVAMTGDGVNDAPALKQAQIGVAMGLSGTEVAKEASCMVLADDNFATIVSAVEEGRGIYNNMKAFIRYMISSNIGEVISIFLTSILGIPDGFNSVQLLWVNLVTDGLPATALSFNPTEKDVMDKPPRSVKEPLITKFVFIRYTIIGTYVGLSTVLVFIYWYMFYDWANYEHSLVKFSELSNWTDCQQWKDFKVVNFYDYDFTGVQCNYFTWGKQTPSTLSLTVLVVIEMLNALNAISDEQSIFKTGILVNPQLIYGIMSSVVLHCCILYIPIFENVFNTVPLDFKDWSLVLIFSFPVILIDEVLKFISRRNSTKQLLERKQLIKKQN